MIITNPKLDNFLSKTEKKGLTAGRQRANFLYFSVPKQPQTREARVEKCVQQILNGKRLNDQ